MSKIAHATTEIMSIHCHSPVQHDVYLESAHRRLDQGKSASLYGLLHLSVHAQKPCLSGLRLLRSLLYLWVCVNPSFFSTEDGEPLKLSNGIPISDNHALPILKLSLEGLLVRTGLFPPMVQIPLQIANPDRDASFPIATYVGSWTFGCEKIERRRTGFKQTGLLMTLDDCLRSAGKLVLRESTRNISAR